MPRENAPDHHDPDWRAALVEGIETQ